MDIKWYGHSCFLFTDANGTRLILDPFHEEAGYNLGRVSADIVCCSHQHFDHNNAEAVDGNPIVITTPGIHEAAGLRIEGIETWHDEVQGKKRGKNIMFRFEMDGLSVLHVGDLGHIIDKDTQKRVGRIDVLLVPVGGVYTINHSGAMELMQLIKPKVTIPMHYSTPHGTIVVGDLKPFFAIAAGYSIHRLNQSEANLTRENLGQGRILIMEYSK